MLGKLLFIFLLAKLSESATVKSPWLEEGSVHTDKKGGKEKNIARLPEVGKEEG